MIEVARELAAGDASTAWTYVILAMHEHIPEQAQRDFWTSHEQPFNASSYVPCGKVTTTDGGYRLS